MRAKVALLQHRQRSLRARQRRAAKSERRLAARYRISTGLGRLLERFIHPSRARYRRPGRPQPAFSSENRHAPPAAGCWKDGWLRKAYHRVAL